MSQLSFRARHLDAYRSMPIYHTEEIPEVADVAAINRAVPQMPTGMEEEEETEHHLQRALSAQQVYGSAEVLVIPVPEIEDVKAAYDKLYSIGYKLPKQYIHAQSYGVDQEIPDYDMDSEDEAWLGEQSKKLELTPIKFEEMLDRLEKCSGQQVVTLQEAKLLLKEDDDLIITVYDYWLNKRLKHTPHALIPMVKTEKRDGSTTNNPYVAFRRRTEKMQTRKNRKNDEVSYEKMLKLRRDLQRAVTMLEMVKKREKCKKELLQLALEILDKRYEMEDFAGTNLAHAEAQKTPRPVFYPLYEQYAKEVPEVVRKQKRKYEKKKHKLGMATVNTHYQNTDVDVMDSGSTEDDALSTAMSLSDHEEEAHPDGVYAFRRKQNCNYHAPLDACGDWPWSDPATSGFGDKKYRYTMTSVDVGPETTRCIGYARRRRGRGGRIIFDRAYTEQRADFWDRVLDSEVKDPDGAQPSKLTCANRTEADNSNQADISTSEPTFRDYIQNNKWLHFAPHEEYDSTSALFNGAMMDLSSTAADLNDNDIDPIEVLPTTDYSVAQTEQSNTFTPIVTAAANSSRTEEIVQPLATSIGRNKHLALIGGTTVTAGSSSPSLNSPSIVSALSEGLSQTNSSALRTSSSTSSMSLLTVDQSYESHQKHLLVLKKDLQDQTLKKRLQSSSVLNTNSNSSLTSSVNCSHNSVVDSKKAMIAISALVNGTPAGKGNGNGINHLNGPNSKNLLGALSNLPGESGDTNSRHHTVVITTTDKDMDCTDSAGLNSIPDVANTMEVT